GRFLTRDPIGDGRNWYGYAGNNPPNRVDPLGLHTIVFGGKTLKVFDDHGKQILRVPAYSGLPGASRDDVRKKNFGPIPEGTYRLDPRDIEYATLEFWTWPGPDYPPSGAWGPARAPLKQDKKTETFGRDGFLLHGGDYVGSEGCVDVGPNIMRVIDEIKSHRGAVKVYVDYSQWKGKVPSGPYSSSVSWAELLGWPVGRGDSGRGGGFWRSTIPMI
ncbi:MAG: hypothetical protein C4342_00865, partial [Armatimonadota bacterium]